MSTADLSGPGRRRISSPSAVGTRVSASGRRVSSLASLFAPSPHVSLNVNEFQELAKRVLPKMYYDFYSGGAEDEHTTLKENVEAFTRIMFRPRVLVDVSKIDTSTSILGYPISAPKVKNFEGFFSTELQPVSRAFNKGSCRT
ncbi:unnamed protein product [Brassica oleracea]